MVFAWGVRWAVVGTRALQSPEWVQAMAQRWPQRIVVGIDAKNGFVATDGWLQVSRVHAVDLARSVADVGIAAVVYTDISKDGMMSGPNFEALAEMRAALSVPVIASGGICTLDHIRRLMADGIPACIIGRALYEGSLNLTDVFALTRGDPPR
jgi:phosphoribosylformimino-5-aminoimidazole carboxamide ribotide isomerase